MGNYKKYLELKETAKGLMEKGDLQTYLDVLKEIQDVKDVLEEVMA